MCAYIPSLAVVLRFVGLRQCIDINSKFRQSPYQASSRASGAWENQNWCPPTFLLRGSLELIIEHFAKPTEEGPGEPHNKISNGIEWLDSNESMRRLEALTIVDAESLEGDVAYEVERAFFIAGWGLMVKASIF